VLGGAITATVVKAQANSAASAGSATSNETGSQLAGLVVAGTPVAALPSPNTRLTLPGLGYVILNEVIGPANNIKSSSGATLTHVYVNMIHVYVDTANTLGVKVGTEIVVGSAYSSFTIPPAPFQVNPTAYSLYASGVNGNLHATSGPWSIASVGCNALSDTNRLATASTPVGSAGAMVDAVSASELTTSTTAAAKSSTGSVNLLKGLIAGQSLVSTASVKRSGASFTRTAAFTFASLVVGGASIAASVAPNTRVNLPGLGYAIVNAQSGTTANGGAAEEVNGVLIYVTSTNAYNLPIGAQIVIAHAHAAIGGF